jgi:hypothetical protein
MATKLQVRRGAYNDWYRVNPVLAEGEIIWVTPNNQFKVGDGTTEFRLLPYVAGPTGATGPGVAAGGTNGQVLTKVGTDPYVTNWSNVVTSVNGLTGDVLAPVLSASNTFNPTTNVVPVTIKGFGSTQNLQEWYTSSASSVSAWITSTGGVVASGGVQAGSVISTGTKGALTAQITSSLRGIVVKAPASGVGANAFEVQDGAGKSVLAVDYAGTFRSPDANTPALVVSDIGQYSSDASITSVTPNLPGGIITFTTNGGNFRNDAYVKFSGFAAEPSTGLSFLNYSTNGNVTYKTIYSGSGTNFSIAVSDFPVVTITSAVGTGVLNGSIEYTCDSAVPFTANTRVVVSGMTTVTGTSLNWANSVVVSSVNGNKFYISSTIAGTGTGGQVQQVVASLTSTGFVYGTATTIGQVAQVQRWQVFGDSNASGVDAAGNLYSKKIYTRDSALLGTSFVNSNADLISGSIGLYDTYQSNQIFNNTTMGNNNGSAIGTQYGTLQVFRQTPTTTSLGAALVVRTQSTTGTGWLQSWMSRVSTVGAPNNNDKSVAELTAAGALRLEDSLTVTTGAIKTTVGGLEIAGTSLHKSILAVGTDTTNAHFIVKKSDTSSSLTTTEISGSVTVSSGNVSVPSIKCSPVAPITLTPGALPGASDVTNFNLGDATVTYPTASGFIVINSASQAPILLQSALLPKNSMVRVYTISSSSTATTEDDWAEGIVDSYYNALGSYYSSIKLTVKGPKAGAAYSATTGSKSRLLVVPIAAYATNEIRTTDTVRVGAEGTKLKRGWGGAVSVTFTSGAGTLSYGSGVTLPVTPASVSVVAQSSNTAITLTLSGPPTTTGIPLKGWTGTSAVADGSYTIYWTGTE